MPMRNLASFALLAVLPAACSSPSPPVAGQTPPNDAGESSDSGKPSSLPDGGMGSSTVEDTGSSQTMGEGSTTPVGGGQPDSSAAAEDSGGAPDSSETTDSGAPTLNPQVLAIMKTVAANGITEYGGGDCGWANASFFPGLMGAYRVTQEPTMLAAAQAWGQKNGFAACDADGKGVTYADNQCCQQTYAELDLADPTHMSGNSIKAGQQVFDSMIATPIAPTSMAGWWWADSLFMAPPAIARMAAATAEAKYFTLLDTMYWPAVKALWDPAHGLFWRDPSFVNKAVYWSRGNGWVIAGTARVLDYLPTSDPHYADYVTQLKTMAAALVPLQNGQDGMWRSNLLTPNDVNKEASGSGFFVFAMAWGISHAVLDSTMYLPIVRKGWDGLVSVVNAKGQVGWVQGVGSAPGATSATGTAAYGAGAFLLAGSEVAKVY
jgi:unsaturated rhamnogalacturonyl hydrolase